MSRMLVADHIEGADRADYILRHPEFAAQMGQHAHERVLNNFLIVTQLETVPGHVGTRTRHGAAVKAARHREPQTVYGGDHGKRNGTNQRQDGATKATNQPKSHREPSLRGVFDEAIFSENIYRTPSFLVP